MTHARADHHRLRAQLERVQRRDGAAHPEGPRLVRGGAHHAARGCAGNHHGPPAQRRVVTLLDGCIESVEIRVEDGAGHHPFIILNVRAVLEVSSRGPCDTKFVAQQRSPAMKITRTNDVPWPTLFSAAATTTGARRWAARSSPPGCGSWRRASARSRCTPTWSPRRRCSWSPATARCAHPRARPPLAPVTTCPSRRGTAHQLENDGSEPLVYLGLSAVQGVDVVQYPATASWPRRWARSRAASGGSSARRSRWTTSTARSDLAGARRRAGRRGAPSDYRNTRMRSRNDSGMPAFTSAKISSRV